MHLLVIYNFIFGSYYDHNFAGRKGSFDVNQITLEVAAYGVCICSTYKLLAGENTRDLPLV